MSLLKKIARSNFFIKLRSWEYWPFGIIQLPIFAYWLWLSLKARSLLFFSASNPSILTGGMFGESKFSVLQKVPERVRAKSALVKVPASVPAVKSAAAQLEISFPFILKPDIGERGRMVKKVSSEKDIEQYLATINGDFIVQAFLDLPLEFGVFYERHPNEPHGTVTSITMKEMLHVVGDGKSTLQELILAKDRAKLQWDALKLTFATQLSVIIQKGEVVELVSIGNHCLGTTFLNGNHLITPRLIKSFDRISQEVEGFYFGRYDLRCGSLQDLEDGNVKVMELNGCGAEPSHIYQPGASLWDAMRALFRHWKAIYQISVANHRLGVPYLSFGKGWRIFRDFKNLSSRV